MSRAHYKASAMDMLRSEGRIVCALGPADFGGIDRVKERLHRLASSGRETRLGLRVDPNSRKWSYRPESVCDHVTTSAPIGRADVVEQLEQLSDSVSIDVPIRMVLAGEYLLLDLSHGFSDAVLPIELFAFLADPVAVPALPGWAEARTLRNPLPRALAGWMARNPGKVVDVLYGKFGQPPAELVTPALAPMEQARVPWGRSPAVAAATSAAGAPAAIRAWRRDNLPEVSVTSILCAAIATALSTRGISTSYSAGFLFDCRRYLRTDGVALGNFAVGIDFEGVDPTNATALHESVAHAIDKGRPLAAGALSTMTYLRTRSALPAISTATAPATADARLTFSDVGRIPQFDGIAWTADPEQSVFVPLSEPSVPESIVVTSMHIRDVFHVTASFHDNFFDRDAVQSALNLAMSDPVALLSAQEVSR
ncbi:hypothetical protein CH289_17190 [Rhodococcus sp. RS1C4]|nr:hypothetical protein [Rhodococcus sp. RS1C4]OZC49914.1 hypothetical protein CH289_17190 [Rhodococcus sp. RS1C4]